MTFTKDWSYGYEMVTPRGKVSNFEVYAWDCPGDFPIMGFAEGETDAWWFKNDGEMGGYKLRNKQPDLQKGDVWIAIYKSSYNPFQTNYRFENSYEDAYTKAEFYGSKVLAVKRIEWTEGEGL